MGRVRGIIRIDVTFNGDATEDTPIEVIGIALGMTEFLDGRQACYFDCQGWGFSELGRIWQARLFAGFGLWVLFHF